jgi:hypothetical protein
MPDACIAGATPGARTPSEGAAPRSWEDCYDPGGADLFEKARAFQALMAHEREAGNHFFRRP